MRLDAIAPLVITAVQARTDDTAPPTPSILQASLLLTPTTTSRSYPTACVVSSRALLLSSSASLALTLWALAALRVAAFFLPCPASRLAWDWGAATSSTKAIHDRPLSTFLTSYLSLHTCLQVATAAEEVKDPGHSLPIGIVGSLSITTVLYMLMW